MTDERMDDLARAALHDPAAFDAYWRALFELESWHYVARDDWAAIDRGEKELNPSPFIGEVDGAPHLLAFTSGARAGDYARKYGLTGPDGNAMVLTMTPAGAVRNAIGYGEQGVAGVVFNLSDVGIRCPISQLEPMLLHYRRLDEVAEAARASGDISAYFAAVFTLPYWYFLVGGRQPDGNPIPLVGTIDGAHHVFAFTSAERAQAFAAEKNPGQPGEILRLPVRTAASIVRQLSTQGIEQVVFDQRQAGITCKAAAAEDVLGSYN